MGLHYRRVNTSNNANKAGSPIVIVSQLPTQSQRIADLRVKTPRLVADQYSRQNIPMTSIPKIPIPEAPDPEVNPAGYLKSIHAVRERSRVVLEKAKKDQLNHFDVDLTKFEDTADYVTSIIKVCSGNAGLCSSVLIIPERLQSRLCLDTTPWQMATL